ncbi:hypothetical protein N7492_005045 [Penicillium capsulatum]|uniref:Cytidyltransferase-like domain-containing protein n=1 Tax=Penicillium capsulatum TaxID=69766 RepID=A0A9W9LQS7_9EURO|nr:hypothetical protein N7492_005045 [Penicillium capsulatum]KAJ6135847.1 hypothetical protein N7512_001007 [Penicillium capsulatum]
MASIRGLRTHYASLLKQFTTSSKDFDILASLPAEDSLPPKILYVLDSSFNPPTLAHLRIASSALLERLEPSSRLLLLLATQNADKPSKPALFEDRLAMMELFAHDLRAHLAKSSTITHPDSPSDRLPTVDIGVTKKPYFVDKASAIEASGCYPDRLEQVHLTGYDTLIRILNPKYYPPEHTLEPLSPLFSRHRLHVTLRPDDEWGGREEQREFLRSLARGDREHEGGRRDWAEKIQLVEGKTAEEHAVSSTKAREAAQSESHDLNWLVPSRVREFMLLEKPYLADDHISGS